MAAELGTGTEIIGWLSPLPTFPLACSRPVVGERGWSAWDLITNKLKRKRSAVWQIVWKCYTPKEYLFHLRGMIKFSDSICIQTPKEPARLSGTAEPLQVLLRSWGVFHYWQAWQQDRVSLGAVQVRARKFGTITTVICSCPVVTNGLDFSDSKIRHLQPLGIDCDNSCVACGIETLKVMWQRGVGFLPSPLPWGHLVQKKQQCKAVPHPYRAPGQCASLFSYGVREGSCCLLSDPMGNGICHMGHCSCVWSIL